ncbi:MAG: phosphoenolpyruvate carboxylase [Chloroflexota bacterium]|nr:phosphoenolpyruvate carboxylase [Chloroflexota bacterium]
MSRRTASQVARLAEPKGIGSASARDPLAREVKLLGALLGQVIIEQEGPELFELVEHLRRAAIRRRSKYDTQAPDETRRAIEGRSAIELLSVARAFTAYFLLVNLAEEKERVRALRRRERSSSSSGLAESIAEAVRLLPHTTQLQPLIDRLLLRPVLTAHPTEARRRTVLLAQRRLYRLLDRFDDPRLTRSEDREQRRHLRQEISTLWQTSQDRRRRPSPLDEVRTAMVFFDRTLFSVTPRIYRAMDTALLERGRGPAETGTGPPVGRSFLRWGSWIGGDRDGHPGVTADITRATLRIHADHVLHGYRTITERLLQTVAIDERRAEVPPGLAQFVSTIARAFPHVRARLERQFAGQPYRQAFGLIGERIERTRTRLTRRRGATRGGYARATDLLDDLRTVQAALVASGADRTAWGDLQDLIWQVETFGFHLAALEVRQHAEIHATALRASDGPATDETLATMRAIREIHAAFGADALPRYVVSFSRTPADVTAILELAARAAPEGAAELAIDIVPLLESRDALAGAGRFLDDLLSDPAYRPHLERRGMRQDVMLGYSDSNKEIGYLGAAWSLYRAQEQLVAAAARADVELTLFHGRGGTIGRGGGPANQALRAQAAGSINGRLALTEQGEMIAERYPSPAIAQRHLEQLTSAIMVASQPAHASATAALADRWRPMMDELASSAVASYRRMVWDDPDFERYFRRATPIDEISRIEIGSRPARRTSENDDASLDLLRAIPWVFAWSQSRTNLPAWYGVGTALGEYVMHHADGGAQLAEAYRDWAFFRSLVDNVELGLAVADPVVAGRYVALAGEDEPMRRISETIHLERRRTVSELARATGTYQPLERSPRLRRSIELRTPYVEILGHLQVHALERLRSGTLGPAERRTTEELFGLTVSGVAAGLQHTG